jgi:hypothetical protein
MTSSGPSASRSSGTSALSRFTPVLRAASVVLLLMVGLGCRSAPPARAQVAPLTAPMNLARMVDESQDIVLARVTAVRNEPHPQYQNLNTIVVTLSVSEALKGSPGRELTFRQYVADIFETQSTLGYRIGEEIVLMLRQPSAEGLTSPVGFEQGRFLVERDAAGNRTVRNSMDNAALFEGLDAASPGLQARLSPALQRLIAEHRAGPIPYDQFKSLITAQIAASQTTR